MAGPASQTITGGRAVVEMPDAQGNMHVAGIFESVSYTRGLSSEEVHTLGAYAPREIPITASNAVSLNCSGYRVFNHGTNSLGGYPTLSQILNYGAVTIKVYDRANGGTAGSPIMTAISCVPTSDTGNFNARATSRITIGYLGIAISDESTDPNGVGDSEAGIPSWP